MQELVESFNNEALGQAFSRNTQAGQKSALNSWTRFCNQFNIDWTLPINEFNSKATQSILIAYLGFEIGLRGMNPNSIKTAYLSSISNSFVLQDIENYFDVAHKSKLVKMVMDGYVRIYHKMNPLSGQKKLAFTIELVKVYMESISVSLSLENLAIELAMKFGIFFLLRKSEFLPLSRKKKSTQSKGLKWKNIQFFDFNGKSVPLHKATNDPNHIKTLTIDIDYSKTDQYGAGRLVSHVRNDSGCCIVNDVVNWWIVLRDHLHFCNEDFLFSKCNEEPIITDSQVAAAMKSTVVYLGWKDDKVSAHSLRYGGATMLAAAGLPQYIIEYFGGWAQDSQALSKLYAKLGSEAVSRVSSIIGNGFNKSLEETRIREVRSISF
jgi:hypothetical protein